MKHKTEEDAKASAVHISDVSEAYKLLNEFKDFILTFTSLKSKESYKFEHLVFSNPYHPKTQVERLRCYVNNEICFSSNISRDFYEDITTHYEN